METITVQAVYRNGILRPKKKLNLPENSFVELKVKKSESAKAGCLSFLDWDLGASA